MDAITSINGETLTTDVARVYFNAAHCADAANTVYDLTLANGQGITQVYLWAGTQNGDCQLNDRRTDQQLLCRAIPGNPRTVGDNATVFDLTLEDLVDTDVVDCENTALEGQPFEIYAFRNEDPGGTDVSGDGYGVAPFIVDVTPPNQLVVTNQPSLRGSSFTISWEPPTDSQRIPQYKLYQGASDDPSAAVFTGTTARQDARSITASAGALGLEPGDVSYLFVSAVDEAAITIGEGNEGPLSEATEVEAAQTQGFCDDPDVDCSGCSVSPMVLPNGQPGEGLWLLGLLLAVVARWRLRR